MTALLRRATAADRGLLAHATLENLNWNGPRFTSTDVEQRPDFRRYYERWPGPADFGFVAELADGEAIGVVWATSFPDNDPGYGYVSEEIPELSVWVAAPHRGFGLGERLIRDAIHDAEARGHTGISLSVEEGNPARHLYDRMGLLPAGADHPASTRLLRF